MYKIGIIGNRDTVLGFMALGFDVRDVSSADDASRALHAMVRSNEYAVIFITEDYAALIAEDMNQYKDLPLPAVISIPGQGGSTGYGLNIIKNAVERAVGADIVFRD